jgi:hypothetical protein
VNEHAHLLPADTLDKIGATSMARSASHPSAIISRPSPTT